MILARVIGHVVASHKDPGLAGLPLLLVQPLSKHSEPRGEPVVATDRIGVGVGEVVLLEVSREAGLGMDRPLVPTDASIIARVDLVEVR